MDFFVDLENFLLKRRMPLKHVMLMCTFLFFALVAAVAGVSEGNYCSVLAVFVTGCICFSFFREIKKIQGHNNLISYQKSVVTSGFDASMFAFFVFAKNGKCIFINRTAQNLFPGLKIRTIGDFIFCFGKHPKVVAAIHNLQVAAENAKQSHIDIPMKLNADNPAIWRIAVSPISGHPEYSGWTIIDLTPSAIKIESLETNSRFLLEIINSSTVGYFCINDEHEIIFCNLTFANWLGKKVDEVLNNIFFRYIIREKSEDLPSNSGKLTGSLPAKITLKSDEKYCEVIVRHIFINRDGNRIYMATRDTMHDSDIIQVLNKTKQYFEHIFEDAPVGIVITDGAEIIRAYNHTFQNIASLAENDKTNTSFLDYIHEDDRENVREKLYQLLDTVHGHITPFEIRFTAQEKMTVMLYVTKVDAARRASETDSLIIYFIDITERKKLQYQFVQSQKMQAVGQLAGGIAHDFNNLLTAMIGYCDLLLEKFLPSDQSFNDIIQIKQNANRAANLVRQLLAFSRQQKLEPQLLRINDMISELTALLKRLLGAKIDLKVVHGRDVRLIKVDQIQFEQVIINLSVNARDAMPDGGVLTIQTSSYSSSEPKFLRGETMPPGNYVLIEVIDTGCGIEEQNLNRIFDPFFSSKEKGHGTGLGLSTVYGIVNQTGGFISVESGIGCGTKFCLYFPEVSEEEQAAQEVKAVDNRVLDLTGMGTILLVEDEDAVRMFSARALRDKGYTVIDSSNGEAALEFISKGGKGIDLIITDVVMPRMDGPTLMKHIKEYNPKMKVIFISGYTEESLQDSLNNDEYDVHFLPKPFNLKELAGKVKEVLGGNGLK
ncbi:MAG: response regulator [Holosporaceae bacterium]|jgi:two-component system cell cycle sensor histidine kinase/response regulator CckA|nr:response regulator [Holosporaceae bacterium]